jgi:hypothetical protein
MSRIATALALLLIALPSPLRAEPVRVTSGEVQVETSLSLARISMAGSGFALSLGTEDFFSDLRFCEPCDPSAPVVNLGATWKPTGTNGGSATVNGVHFPEVFFGLGTSGTFTTENFTLTGSESVTVTMPFTFRGTIAAFDSSNFNPFQDTPVFTLPVFGSGTARAHFIASIADGTPLFSNDALPGTDFNLQYVFSDVSTTPEPGTLLLIASGAAVAEARRRRRRTV